MARFGGRVAWLATGIWLLTAGSAFAAEAGAPAGGGVSTSAIRIITAGFALAIASAVGGLAQSRAIVAALDGIARQPNAAPRIQLAMIIGLALIESLVIYVLLISFIVFFAIPAGG